jgi:hypothetical protein
MALANDKSQSNTVPISVVDKGMDFQESDIDPVIGIGPSGVVDDDVIATEPF